MSYIFTNASPETPHIPLPVVAIVAFGFSTSACIYGTRLWSKTPNGVWDIPERALVQCNLGSPRALLAYRAAVFLYTLSVGVGQTIRRGPRTLAYFTMWSWWSLVLYFGLAAYASWRAIYGKRRRASPTIDSFGYVVVALFHLVISTVLLVDVCTWLLLVPMLLSNPDPEKVAWTKKMFYNFYSYNTHGANAALALGELLLNCIPFMPYLMGIVGLYISIFGLWAFTWFRLTGLWLYPFLDASKPWAPVAYGGVYVASWLFFGVVFLQFRVRDALVRALKGAKRAT